MANLRNCPLCGGVAEMELLTGYIEANVPDEYFVVCSNCGCGVGGANEQEALELWNNIGEKMMNTSTTNALNVGMVK